MIGDHHRVFETSDSSEYLFVVGATEKHKAVLMEDFDISSTGLGESVIEARLKDSQ